MTSEEITALARSGMTPEQMAEIQARLDATELIDGCRDTKSIERHNDAMDTLAVCASDDIAALLDECRRLQKITAPEIKRGGWVCDGDTLLSGESVLKELRGLRARVLELTEALRPFARWSDMMGGNSPATVMVDSCHLHRAADALKGA